MLWKASSIDGYAIAAKDGHLGKVSDFLFDDASWLIRWLVVDTGKWLSGRKVLLPPSVLGHPNEAAREFSVSLSQQQVKDSPDIDTHQPVSRRLERSIYNHYGWSSYWGNGLYMGDGCYASGGMAPAPVLPSGLTLEELAAAVDKDSDPHLRSVEAVVGYHINASDGGIGHVEDFLVDDADWSVHYLIVETNNWWPGKKVLISPRSVRAIAWQDRFVDLTVNLKQVKDSPAYDGTMSLDRAYEKHFHDHYDGARPGDRP